MGHITQSECYSSSALSNATYSLHSSAHTEFISTMKTPYKSFLITLEENRYADTMLILPEIWLRSQNKACSHIISNQLPIRPSQLSVQKPQVQGKWLNFLYQEPCSTVTKDVNGDRDPSANLCTPSGTSGRE